MCDCWGCRTGNGHGATPPEGWTPDAEASPGEIQPASDAELVAWVDAAKAWPDQLDIAYIVTATDLRIKADAAELAKYRAGELSDADAIERLSVKVEAQAAELERLRNPDIEALAALEHERWSGWMRYLFSKCGPPDLVDESRPIPKWAVDRWGRQCQTDYQFLSEAEKESDRVEVRKTLALLGIIPQTKSQ
jgi:hypothetical protein